MATETSPGFYKGPPDPKYRSIILDPPIGIVVPEDMAIEQSSQLRLDFKESSSPLKLGPARRSINFGKEAFNAALRFMGDQFVRLKNPHLEKHSNGNWFDTRPSHRELPPEVK